jgi:hypothetical protein
LENGRAAGNGPGAVLSVSISRRRGRSLNVPAARTTCSCPTLRSRYKIDNGADNSAFFENANGQKDTRYCQRTKATGAGGGLYCPAGMPVHV